jgi:hypothetical protein
MKDVDSLHDLGNPDEQKRKPVNNNWSSIIYVADCAFGTNWISTDLRTIVVGLVCRTKEFGSDVLC